MIYLFSLACLLSVSRASTYQPECDERLGVPLAMTKHFADFTDDRFLTPLRWFRLEPRKGIFLKLELACSGPTSDYLDNLRAKCGVAVTEEDGLSRMTFEDLTLDRDLDPDFTYRTMLSHLLTREPDIDRIKFSFFGLAEEGVVRGAISRGISPREALTATSAYRALRAFGFEYEDHRVELMKDEEMAYPGDAGIDLTVARVRRGVAPR